MGQLRISKQAASREHSILLDAGHKHDAIDTDRQKTVSFVSAFSTHCILYTFVNLY